MVSLITNPDSNVPINIAFSSSNLLFGKFEKTYKSPPFNLVKDKSSTELYHALEICKPY